MRNNLTQRTPQTVWDFMNEVNSIFDNTLSPAASELATRTAKSFNVQTDIEELDDCFLLSFDIPGVKREDIHLDFTEGRLTISGERKKETRSGKEDGFKRFEKSYGRFERSFQLPSQIDEEKIQAHYDNGQLEVMVPKSQVAKPKSIPIETGKGGLFSKLLGNKSESKEQH